MPLLVYNDNLFHSNLNLIENLCPSEKLAQMITFMQRLFHSLSYPIPYGSLSFFSATGGGGGGLVQLIIGTKLEKVQNFR